MKQEIEKEGGVILYASPQEVRMLFDAVISKHLIMRRVPEHSGACNAMLSLQIALNEALIASNEAILRANPPAKPEVVRIGSPEPGIWKRFYNWLNPPFSVSDFENAKTVCGLKHYITSMEFGGDATPSIVHGQIFHEGKWHPASWNSHGKCACECVGYDAVCYDLRRSRKDKTTTGKCIAVATSVLVTALVAYLFIY